jgi:hypothetical protein
MNQTTASERPTVHRFRERLAESRYFTISLLLHVIFLFVVGSIVLVQQKTEPFVPMGVEIPDNIAPLNTESKPAEIVPPETNLTSQPNVVTPPSAAPEPAGATIPMVAVNFGPTKWIGESPKFPRTDIPKTPTVPTHGVGAKDFDLRFMKDGSGQILMTSGWPAGAPRPTKATENAVLKGLRWLRDHQNEDGSWGEKNKGAMTGLALLCFLGHGELPESPEFGLTVNRAVQWLVDGGTTYGNRLSMTKDGWGDNAGVYEHAIATYALGEFYTLTKDERLTELLPKAVAFIVEGQGPDGGWAYRYDKSQPGDTSVSGWQVQALKAAYLTKLNLPGVDAALDRAMKNFDRVQGPNGGYGYRGPEDRYSLTGVGVLSELFWRGTRDKDLRRSVEFITDKSEKEFPVRYQGEKGDLYAWYYHSQAMLMYGGAAWTNWERRFSGEIVQAQTPAGDWPPMRASGVGHLQDADHLTGQVYRTSLCVLMLEVYYRYLPIHRTDAAANPLKIAAR